MGKIGRLAKSKTQVAEKTQMVLDDKSITDEIDVANQFQYFALKSVRELEKIKTTIKGYSSEDIKRIVNNPESFQVQLIDLSNFMYRRSGLYKSIIDYFANMAMYSPYIKTNILTEKFFDVKPDLLKKNYVKYAGAINRIRIEKELNKILTIVFLEDAYCGYFLETSTGDEFLYNIPNTWCSIHRTCDDTLIYGINPKAVSQSEIDKLPEELQALLKQPTTPQDPYVYPEPEKCFCIKHNIHLTYLYPPFFDLLKDIADIDDYKELAKAKTEGENYNLLALEVPTSKEKLDDLLFTNKVIDPTFNMARSVLPSSFGVIVSPLPVKEVQWRSNATAEKNKVKDAIDDFYDSAGVPKALMGSGTSSGIIHIAILQNSTKLFKLYRQIEKIINLKMIVQGYVYPSYQFEFKLMDVTYLTQKDVVAEQLKVAQASTPTKTMLLSAMGISPSAMIGNDYMENEILKLGDSWTTLKTSYTQSSNTGGRPSNSEKGLEITESTETGIENSSNLSENRW